jgi:predicted RNA-binding Zn ribbon-like protein
VVVVDRQQAPEPLSSVQEFVNTAVWLYGREQLVDPPALRDWLVDRGLLDSDASVTADDRSHVLDFREALRTLFLPRVDGSLDPAATAEVNRVAVAASLLPELHPDATQALTPQRSGVPSALGNLCAVVLGAFADGSWRRLKTCQAPDCRWLYYDRSRNLSGTWCEPALCGTRMRMRAYRNRRQSGATQSNPLHSLSRQA